MSTRRETEAERRARYAVKDVTDKLGMRASTRVRVVGKGDASLLAKVRAKLGRRFVGERARAEIVLFWPASPDEITPMLQKLKTQIEPNGGIWVIGAKRGHEANSYAPYMPDTVLIPLGLAAGLVDNKIRSVSDHESAMRFVIRKQDRVSARRFA